MIFLPLSHRNVFYISNSPDACLSEGWEKGGLWHEYHPCFLQQCPLALLKLHVHSVSRSQFWGISSAGKEGKFVIQKAQPRSRIFNLSSSMGIIYLYFWLKWTNLFLKPSLYKPKATCYVPVVHYSYALQNGCVFSWGSFVALSKRRACPALETAHGLAAEPLSSDPKKVP